MVLLDVCLLRFSDDAPNICAALCAALADHRVDELTGVSPLWLRAFLLHLFDQRSLPLRAALVGGGLLIRVLKETTSVMPACLVWSMMPSAAGFGGAPAVTFSVPVPFDARAEHNVVDEVVQLGAAKTSQLRRPPSRSQRSSHRCSCESWTFWIRLRCVTGNRSPATPH